MKVKIRKTMTNKDRRRTIVKNRRSTDVSKLLESHFEEDKRNFLRVDEQMEKQTQDHEKFDATLSNIEKHMEKSTAFMESMSGLNDFVSGTRLLKKPSLWLVAVVVGVVALFGGFKTIIGWFVISKT